ncbi:hypothetical protein MKEN_01295600 [Mycena kentingensis (nom. inval.)]|nr:hypothetical protein MKEN_01295600 [Mycena kentingensis (nom. inval.)]
MCDVHYHLPPSVSLPLDCLEESPILRASLGVSCSSESIPILFDFVLDGDDAEVDTDRRVSSSQRDGLSPTSLTFDHRALYADASFGSTRSLNLHIPASESQSYHPITPGGILAPSQSTLSARSLNTTASLSPSPSTASCTSGSSPNGRLHRKFKFPIDLNGPSPMLPTSRSCASQMSTESQLLAVPIARAPSPQTSPCYSADPVNVPDNVAWLKDLALELLVDQEGFRSVRPTFKLAGFRKHVRGWSHGAPESGWALFRPVLKQSYPFHYAPLDSLPILRRLITNDDESRDYISRQATLALKTTGVYVVHGSESFHHPTSGVKTGAKLRWRFEYLVEQKVDETGRRLVEGEKVFTPLTFLCDPWLVHPSQGHKMKLMHVVKKSVATKLVAERVELPVKDEVKAVNGTGWGLHRRGFSGKAAGKHDENWRYID